MLAYRRIRGKLIETYKILTDRDAQEVSRLFAMRNDSTTRGHNRKIKKKKTKNKKTFKYQKIFLLLPSCGSVEPIPEEIMEALTQFIYLKEG